MQSGKLGSASNLSKEGSASGFRGLSSVSMGAGSGSAAPLEEAEGPRGYTRSGFVVVPLDGNFRGEAVRHPISLTVIFKRDFISRNNEPELNISRLKRLTCKL